MALQTRRWEPVNQSAVGISFCVAGITIKLTTPRAIILRRTVIVRIGIHEPTVSNKFAQVVDFDHVGIICRAVGIYFERNRPGEVSIRLDSGETIIGQKDVIAVAWEAQRNSSFAMG